jgi:hypothetical protein
MDTDGWVWVQGSEFKANRDTDISPPFDKLRVNSGHEGREEPRMGANEHEGRIHHREHRVH